METCASYTNLNDDRSFLCPCGLEGHVSREGVIALLYGRLNLQAYRCLLYFHAHCLEKYRIPSPLCVQCVRPEVPSERLSVDLDDPNYRFIISLCSAQCRQQISATILHSHEQQE